MGEWMYRSTIGRRIILKWILEKWGWGWYELD
jgi:hypothetical protein